MHQLLELDTQLLVLLNGKGNVWLDAFWMIYTNRLTWLPIFILMIVILWRTGDGNWRYKALQLLLLIVVLALLDQISSSLLKPLVGRLRPSHDPATAGLLHYVNDYRGGLYGFPSGHATTSAGIATWLWLSFKNRFARICFVFFAMAMGYSRIYLGVHYPLDVLVGFALGVALVWLVRRVLQTHLQIPAHERSKSEMDK